MGTMEGLEYQAGPPEVAGGQGWPLKGSRREVMGSGLHFIESNTGVLQGISKEPSRYFQ